MLEQVDAQRRLRAQGRLCWSRLLAEPLEPCRGAHVLKSVWVSSPESWLSPPKIFPTPSPLVRGMPSGHPGCRGALLSSSQNWCALYSTPGLWGLLCIKLTHPIPIQPGRCQRPMCFGWTCLVSKRIMVSFPLLSMAVFEVLLSILSHSVSVLCSAVSILKALVPRDSSSLRCSMCWTAVLEEGTPQLHHYFWTNWAQRTEPASWQEGKFQLWNM